MRVHVEERPRIESTRTSSTAMCLAVVETAVRTGTVLEVSAQPDRLDLSDVHVRLAIEAGAKLSIDTDAHSVARLEAVRFGVMNARRGWATAGDVVNTREWPELKTLLKGG